VFAVVAVSLTTVNVLVHYLDSAVVSNFYFVLTTTDTAGLFSFFIPVLFAGLLSPQIERMLITGSIAPVKGYD